MNDDCLGAYGALLRGCLVNRHAFSFCRESLIPLKEYTVLKCVFI